MGRTERVTRRKGGKLNFFLQNVARTGRAGRLGRLEMS